MSKVRVHELAREANMSSKALTAKLIELGYDVTSHSSTVDASIADEIRNKVLKPMKSEDGKRSTTTVRRRNTVIRRRTTVVRRRTPDEVEDDTVVDEEMEENTFPTTSQPKKQPETEVTKNDNTVCQQESIASERSAKEPAQETPQKEQDREVAHQHEKKPKDVVENREKEKEKSGNSHDHIEDDIAKEGKKESKQNASETKTTEAKAIENKAKKEKPAKKNNQKNRKPAPRQEAARVLRHIELPTEPKEQKESRNTRNNNRPKKKGKTSQPVSRPAPKDPFSNVSAPIEPQNEESGRGGRKKTKKGRTDRNDDKNFENKRSSNRRSGKSMKFTHFGANYGERNGSGRKRKGKKAPKQVLKPTEMKASKRKFKVYDTISVGDLAQNMKVKAGDVIARLMALGVMATINQQVDYDTATIIATEFGYDVEQGLTEEIGLQIFEEAEEGGEQELRAPVVTVMGHVDHGKTSILDAIRKTDVAEGEAGGITQHIGAYHVKSTAGNVTFVDTPGHAAFTEMRSRGAQVTDIVVLVVAADDGVMDQTREAIAHSKAANVPIIVAVNKVDKDNADPDRVKRELSELDLMPEDWGGDTMYVETSAKKHLGIDTLMETIMLLAEVQELKADTNRKARGRVIEAQLHKGRGPVATVLVQDGTLRQGDNFVAGQFSGKVRSMLDDRNRRVDKAGPAIPVEVQGLSGVPSAGDEFIVVTDEKMARNVSQERSLKARESDLADKNKVTFENLFEQMNQGEVKELKVILRSDVQGTLEAFAKAAEDLSTEEIKVKVLHEGTGTVTESDILLASASDAIIIGFNVRPSVKVKELAEKEGVEVRSYDVIYHALDDIKNAMVGMLEPTFEEDVIGTAEVRDTFSVPKVGVIAGCFVLQGKMQRNAGVRVLRDGIVIYTGKIESLKRFKDDAKEVLSGYECGIGVEKYNDIKVGDTLEAFIMKEVEATL